MIKKIILQATLAICVFFGLWFLLSKIDWLTTLNVKETTKKTEEKLGDIFWDVFKNKDVEVQDSTVKAIVDSLTIRICESNNIKREKLKVHILESNEVNAFALPDGHLVVFTGLIRKADNHQELCGVLAHEIAHIELNHIMKKLIKEAGVSVLISITTGETGGQVIKETAGMLSSSAYDRALEKEADLKAVDYLLNAAIDPQHFAEFLFKMAQNDSSTSDYLTWLSTHPHAEDRAAYLSDYNQNNPKNFTPVIKENTWQKLKTSLED
ncbi:MAG: M48 family metallopeptidase [Cyclobacteriaceae bacterium]|jgi:predicted Zn-dependent protease|nr:M48 family metallopeptidase [Cytophagales bacterium]MCZ8329212.1 M48 family metallopeptidase [Cyclobacteriaceae bacterium]